MKCSKIITIEGLTIDLSRLKAIKITNNMKLGDTNVLVADLNVRYEYHFNPNKDKFKGIRIKESVEMKYVDHGVAGDVAETLRVEWQKYLDSIADLN